MALPSSGQLSLGNIRTELGMPGVTNFSLIKASTSAPGYPILNPNSPVTSATLSQPPYKISDWYGYSSATIRWFNGTLGGSFGQGRLQIYVNGILRVDNINPASPPNPFVPFDSASGVIVLNNGDTFYATFTPITFGFFSNFQSLINTFRYTSPFGIFDYFLLNQTTNASTPSFFTPITSPTQTAIIQPTNLAVFEIGASC